MPKVNLKFGRRKSSGYNFDDAVEGASDALTPTATTSFRVLERPEKIINLNGGPGPQDRVRPVQRPFNSPLNQARGKSAEDLGLGAGLNRSVDAGAGVSAHWALNGGRGSGGTTTSNSSGYYESSSASARHSSSSTLPSSVDAEKEPEDDELFPRKAKTTPMYQSVSANDGEPPQTPSSFTTRAARAFAFGQNKHTRNGSASNNQLQAPAIPTKSHSPPRRERATTNSSYASTAKPEVNLSIGTSDFGMDFSEFGTMFGPSKRDSLPLPPPIAAFHRTESEPMFPARAHSRQAFTESVGDLKNLRDDAGSPYSWDGPNENDGLVSSSALSSPRADGTPAPPSHNTGTASAFLGKAKAGYARVPDRSSPGPERISQDSRNDFVADESNESDEELYVDEDERWARRVSVRNSQQAASARQGPLTRTPLGMPAQATAGASKSGPLSPESSEGGSMWKSESRNTTPRAAKLGVKGWEEGESLFDSSPQGPPSQAIKPHHVRTQSGTPKKMTKAQFDRLQRSESSADQSEDEEHHSDEFDDEDEVEKAKQLTKQRRKQEANMAVYRQQMKKVTGGGPSDLPSSMPRPAFDRAAASAPVVSGLSVHLGGIGGQPPADVVRGKQIEEEDDDVPLGILQAHGFPSASRTPERTGSNEPAQQRRTSVAGSVVGGGAGQGNLPPFARRLPADPYFGAGLVNQTTREPLGMTGPPSMYGVPPAMPAMQQQPSYGHPGGLVGVIAGEERAKAARRGSPNPATGTFGSAPLPLPNNMPGMMPRSMSNGSLALPQTYMPTGTNQMMQPMGMQQPMSMMPQTPQQQNNDQMQQFMQMQMQLMQSVLAMQQQQMGQTPAAQQQPQQTQDYLGVPVPGNSRASIAPSIRNQALPNQGRAMTMGYTPTPWDVPPGIRRPSSAMPTTYAPPGMNFASSDGLGPGYTPSIAPSERSNVGQPSRYRPVNTNPDGSVRSQSLTSSMTLQAFGNRQPSPVNQQQTPPPPPPHAKSTIRMVDKQKGSPRVMTKPVAADEDDDEGWAEMRKKREDKKKFRGKKDREAGGTLTMDELYQTLE